MQAVRGVYPLVRRLAQIDKIYNAGSRWRAMCSRASTASTRCCRVDNTLDLIDSRNWPRTGPQPNATLLDRVTLLRLGGRGSAHQCHCGLTATRPR